MGHTQQLTQFYHEELSLALALTTLVRDLKYAPITKNSWKKTNPQEIIWHHNDNDYGFKISRQRLMRSVGNFNQTSGKWTKRAKSVLLYPISSLNFSLHEKNSINAVTVTVYYKNHTSSCCVSLKNGSKFLCNSY
jgi:hypothetical protein